MVAQEAGSADPMADRPIRCEIEVLPSGDITLLRSPGCTCADAMDMCRAVGGGGVRVRDVTPSAAGDVWQLGGEHAESEQDEYDGD